MSTAAHARGRRVLRRSWRDRLLGTTSRRVRAVLALGVVVGLGTVSTMALWSDSATATSTFKAGNLDLRVASGGSADLKTVAISGLALTNMAPGSSSAGLVSVKNLGSLALTYGITGSAVDGTPTGLGAGLRFTITTGTTTGTAPTVTCTGAALTGANGVALSSIAVTGRALAATTGAETLCVSALLPTTAPTGLQGASTTATLTFATSLGT